MALNFPTNPTNNQEYEGYYWDATDEVWKLSDTPPIIDIDDIANVDTAGVVDGQALVYDAANSEWVAGDVASGPAPANTIDSDNIALDFSDGVELEQRVVTGDVTFTASNYTSGAKKTVYLEGDTVQRSLTFPTAWNFITDKPTAIGADKKNILDLNSFGTSESTTVALWLGASSFEPITASGGTMQTMTIGSVEYQLHVFKGSDDFIVSSIGDSSDIEYLIVAGGGGGGGWVGSGGGAGGFLSGAYSLSSAATYPAIVGAGGLGGDVANATTLTIPATNGSNSTILGYSAIGGGRGGSWALQGPNNGGSGGGGNANSTPGAGTSGQGFAGGSSSDTSTYTAGGGGGAGAVGGSPTSGSGVGGSGGSGKISTILTTEIASALLVGEVYSGSLYFAGGGGGGANTGSVGGTGGVGGGADGTYNNQRSPNIADSAPDNTGGGGGGSGEGGPDQRTVGGAGGSGIIIIRYPLTDPN